MTKVYQTVTVESPRLSSRTCDKCGCDLPLHDDLDHWFDLDVCSERDEERDVSAWGVADLCHNCIYILYDLLKENGFKITEDY